MRHTLKHILTRGDVRVIFICVVVILISCSGIAYSLYREYTVPIPADGGAYVEGAVGRVNTLNPVYCTVSTIDQDICRLIFSGLTRYDPETNEVWGDIAYGWDIDDGGTVYTFHLRENVFWHDGTPLTADDVLFTYHDVLQSPEFDGVLKDTFRDVDIAVTDAATVVFTLEKENAFFPGFLTVGILPKHLLSDTPVRDLPYAAFNRRPIGSGMYMLDDWIVDQTSDHLELARFEKYYGTKPHITKFTYFAFNTFSELYDNIGSLTGIRHIPPDERDNFTNRTDFELHDLVLNRHRVIIFNTARTTLRSLQVRKGLMFAINYDEIASSVPSIQLVNSPIPHLSTGSNVYDIDAAKEELYLAGWKIFSELYDDGFRRNDKQEKLELTLVTTKDETLQRAAHSIQSSWAAVGVDVTIQALDIGDLEKDVITPRNYDMLLLGQSLETDFDLYTYWHSSQAAAPGLNLAQYKSPEVDILIEKIRHTHDFREQLALTYELTDIIKKDVPAIFLYTPAHTYATRKDAAHIFVGQNIGNVADRFALINKWYIREKRIWGTTLDDK